MLIGDKVRNLPSCHSTNEFLKDLMTKEEVRNGEVVFASDQTNGKGQRGNSWESNKNENLTFSFYIQLDGLTANNQFSLNYFVTLALHSFLFSVLANPEELKIKWPNDIYVGREKIAGVLIENQVVSRKVISSVIGIGLNVNQHIFHTKQATSISILNQDNYDLKEAFGLILHHLNRRVKHLMNLDLLREEYFKHLLGFQEVRRFLNVKENNKEIQGKIIDVCASGELVLMNDKLEEEVFDVKQLKFLF